MMGFGVRVSVLALGVAVAGTTDAGCIDGAPLVGVNLAGAEFNSKKLPGVMHKDYTYPAAADLSYFASKGATTVRLPFRWERAQRALMGELDSGEMAAISKVVAAAAPLGLCVILDLHNYGSYTGRPIGSAEVPNEAFLDFWTKMGERFPDASQVAFGLMNEPSKIPLPAWTQLARHTVRHLRDADVANLLMVSGGRWSGVHEWTRTFSGTSNAAAFADLADPLGRTVFEVHQYFDRDFSGTHAECQPPGRFDNMFSLISEWARTNGRKLFLGEFGAPATSGCLQTLDHVLTLVSDRQVWRGWTYWAAGRWWGSYPMSIQPTKEGAAAPQMGVVEKHLSTR